MYIVTIKNGTKSRKIHSAGHKLSSGSLVKGINTIDTFTFSILPSNHGFNVLHDFTTLVEIFNTNKNRYEFYGRVLCSTPAMSESGLITKDVTCESFFGFLCDSQQPYVKEKNWTVRGLLKHLLDVHNSQMEDYKHFQIGEVTVTDPNDNLYVGIQRKNTWDTMKETLLDKLGGELRFRVVDGVIYLDYLVQIGEHKTTEIALSRNMKAITKEQDPSAYVTRLIPLGAKISENSEERLDITSVNNGKNYIDDTQAISEYGLHVGYVEFDDVTNPTNLLNKGRAWLKDNNKVLIKYSITALDLSLLGLDMDDFEVHNFHPVKNKLLDIDDTARIIKKNINICEETKSTIEIGENFKTLSDIQREQYDSLKKINADVAEIKKDYVTNEVLISEITKTQSLITQNEEEILLRVSASYVKTTNFNTYKEETKTELGLKVGIDENDRIVSMLNASADIINLKSNRLTISSDNFTLAANGTIKATAGEIGGCSIFNGVLQIKNANIAEKLTADVIDVETIKITNANIAEKLTIGNLPDTIVETNDIKDFQSAAGVVSIIEGKVTADYIKALGISVENLDALAAKIGGFTITPTRFESSSLSVSGGVTLDKQLLLTYGGNPSIGVRSRIVGESTDTTENQVQILPTGIRMDLANITNIMWVNGTEDTSEQYVVYLDFETMTVKFRDINDSGGTTPDGGTSGDDTTNELDDYRSVYCRKTITYKARYGESDDVSLETGSITVTELNNNNIVSIGSITDDMVEITGVNEGRATLRINATTTDTDGNEYNVEYTLTIDVLYNGIEDDPEGDTNTTVKSESHIIKVGETCKVYPPISGKDTDTLTYEVISNNGVISIEDNNPEYLVIRGLVPGEAQIKTFTINYDDDWNEIKGESYVTITVTETDEGYDDAITTTEDYRLGLGYSKEIYPNITGMDTGTMAYEVISNDGIISIVNNDEYLTVKGLNTGTAKIKTSTTNLDSDGNEINGVSYVTIEVYVDEKFGLEVGDTVEVLADDFGYEDTPEIAGFTVLENDGVVEINGRTEYIDVKALKVGRAILSVTSRNVNREKWEFVTGTRIVCINVLG